MLAFGGFEEKDHSETSFLALTSVMAIGVSDISRVTGTPVPTLNVWIQRGLIPWIEVGQQGKARSFTLDDVFHVACMAQLVSLGYAAPFASEVAAAFRRRFQEPAATLVIAPPTDTRGFKKQPEYHFFNESSEIELISKLSVGRTEPAISYTVVRVSRLAEMVREALGDKIAASTEDGDGQEAEDG
jgi:hypothetical protein